MNQTILEAKQAVIAEIVSKAKEAQSITVAEYRGLTVAQIQALRRALASEGAEMCVYKNSMTERAIKELGYECDENLLTGPNAIIFSSEYANGPKVAVKYAKRYGNVLSIKGGFVEGKCLDKAGITEISKMPGREGLLSMFLSCLQAPVRQFACAVQAVADKQ